MVLLISADGLGLTLRLLQAIKQEMCEGSGWRVFRVQGCMASVVEYCRHTSQVDEWIGLWGLFGHKELVAECKKFCIHRV